MLVGVGVVRLGMEIMLLLFPKVYISIGEYVFGSLILQSIKANLVRYRTYVDFIQEASVPLFLFGLLNKHNSLKQRIFYGVCAVGMGGVVFLSNWRGRVLVYVFSLLIFILSIIFLKKKKLRSKKLFWLGGLIVGVVLMFGILDRVGLNKIGFSVVDRLRNADFAEDVSTIEWRVNVFKDSYDMGRSGFIGVGVGNFYEWTNFKKRHEYLIREYGELADAAIYHGPHNVFFQYFAEIGIIGTGVFVIYLFFAFVKDLHRIKSQKLYGAEMSFIVSFWTLLGVVQFYPATSLSFYVLFFVLRGVLDNKKLN